MRHHDGRRRHFPLTPEQAGAKLAEMTAAYRGKAAADPGDVAATN
jgi:hypothetical protein